MVDGAKPFCVWERPSLIVRYGYEGCGGKTSSNLVQTMQIQKALAVESLRPLYRSKARGQLIGEGGLFCA